MKKKGLVAFSIILLCILFLPTAFVCAVTEGYENTDYQAIRVPVVDGKWTTTNEWYDAMIPPNLPAGVHWSEKWEYVESTYIVQYVLFEFFTDNTNDTGDYIQLCYDTANDGGSAPNSNDVKIEYVGHSESGLKVYQGNGTGWVEYTGAVSRLLVNSTLGPSSFNSTPHWITELRVEKSGILDISASGYTPPIRVALYDASNSAAGVKEWPPASGDDPSKWGRENGTLDNIPTEIPESLTIVGITILSSVALASSFYFLRRRSKNPTPKAGRTQ